MTRTRLDVKLVSIRRYIILKLKLLIKENNEMCTGTGQNNSVSDFIIRS